MKIRMKISVSGAFHNDPDGVARGQIVDVDDEDAKRYINLGYAEAVKPEPVEERAVAPRGEERAEHKRAPRIKPE